MNVSSHSLRGYAYIGESKIVSDDATPAVGAKLDLRMGHCAFQLSQELE
jgi:hypothetical protein